MAINVKKEIIARCANIWDSFYLYDETDILENIERLKATFPQVEFLYSLKCNSDPHVLSCVFAQGFGADAASAGEVELAHKAGVSRDQIYYSAPGKSIRDIESALHKAVLVADSIDEIKRIQSVAERLETTVEIGIRINPDFSFLGSGGGPSKFGIDVDQTIRFLRDDPCQNIKITGIHVHLKSQELNAGILANYYERVFCLSEKIEQFCGKLAYINMGSGMGIQYVPSDSPLDIVALGRFIAERLNRFKATHGDTKIIIEVGRYAVGKSGYYVTKVMDRKMSYGKTYLILNNTLNGFLRPSLAKLIEHYASGEKLKGAEPLFTSTDAFSFLTLKDGTPSEQVTLVGNLCTATDVIAEDILMPHLECGDVVIISNAGGYAATLSPMQFSSQERPKEVFLAKNEIVLVNE